MKLAIVGIRGLPNTYGGFETLADYLVQYLANEIEITVYCSSKDMDSKLKEYKGAKLIYIPVSSHGARGILYDSISLIIAVSKFDKILFLGFGAGFVIPFLARYRSKIVLNIGGLDWKRNKWSPFAQKVIKKAEELLVKNSGKIVSDNIGIKSYLLKEYHADSTLIAYGGDQATYQEITYEALAEYPFLKRPYALSVTRIQSDNNIEVVLKAFAKQQSIPLVMIGNWNDSEFGKNMKRRFGEVNNLILLDAIYDRDKLDILRSNCTLYIHGHSAGGTNPSLVEAMYLGLPIVAFASGYNEYTTHNEALYFSSEDELIDIVDNYMKYSLADIGEKLKRIAKEEYRWEDIANKYKEVFLCK